MSDEKLKPFRDAMDGDWYLENDKDYEYRIKERSSETLSKIRSLLTNINKVIMDGERDAAFGRCKKTIEDVSSRENSLLICDGLKYDIEELSCVLDEIQEISNQYSTYLQRMSDLAKRTVSNAEKELGTLGFDF